VSEFDWSIFHRLNSALVGHDGVADVIADFSSASVWLFVAAVAGLWVAGRPGTRSPLRRAAIAAPMAAAIGLGVNQVLSHLWERVRPTLAHPEQAHLFFVPPSGDPSFPSDHATAAFAVAFAVFFLAKRVGVGFLVAATLVALSRVFIGLHYPSDVVAGVLIGAASAWIFIAAAVPLIDRLVDVAGRFWDPVAVPVWRWLSRLRAAQPTRRG